VLIAATIMAGLAGFFGVVLAVSQRYFSVDVDPRIEQAEQLLPGTNCGACGEPGCAGFAEKVVAGELIPARCTVSSPLEIQRLASFLGVEAGTQEKRVARLHCAGGKSSVRQLAEYHGVDSCRAAVVVNAGWRACPWGCLGLGDCDDACTFDAIAMTAEALPRVDVAACTACGDCVDVCPLDLFALAPLSQRAIVQCSAPLTGELARSLCAVACDACGRCALDAADGVIEMENGLPRVRQAEQAEVSCTWRCPTGAIQWVEGDQFSGGSGGKETVHG
jgi:RnfABCDGE-type electron transport complex B subunit